MGATDRLVQFIADTHYDTLPEVERIIGMVEALETLPDLRQLMVILGHKSVP